MAAYSTASEVREMIKSDALNTLIGNLFIDDEQEQDDKIMPLIEEAIADAQGEIDGYLAKRYNVPLETVPKVVNKFAKDMALYNLFSRAGIDEDSREKSYLTRYNAAIKFFTLVAKGDVDLGIDGTQSAASTGFSVNSNRRVFSRDSLRGM